MSLTLASGAHCFNCCHCKEVIAILKTKYEVSLSQNAECSSQKHSNHWHEQKPKNTTFGSAKKDELRLGGIVSDSLIRAKCASSAGGRCHRFPDTKIASHTLVHSRPAKHAPWLPDSWSVSPVPFHVYILYIALHYITLHFITPHHIALHCITSHCISL